jgi:hypothetical protein
MAKAATKPSLSQLLLKSREGNVLIDIYSNRNFKTLPYSDTFYGFSTYFELEYTRMHISQDHHKVASMALLSTLESDFSIPTRSKS